MNVRIYVHEDKEKVLQWIYDNHDDGLYYIDTWEDGNILSMNGCNIHG
jgi:hypothetical protein